ncbi:malonate-semialdehyde dehydrogenase (acetylating)/methylmalonate-semialdehyde dehydrogenase [Rhodothalassium salexigens DSM 2132]|uniref:methylmalonate-semialdehyde dehydrogenase (CoA acylating) n=1 Tax=Rhodothalassium salexigens DSM 2132 TaxID=1188247 RepID=A0A4R2PTE1_RHOSA|nr:CoA-acylating methylmalonate-semialdehyde dehydrogenase [Rhodothalassium salexigens]MBB4210113.1 malonate-semialdehyde dehydrogenase (acetylating)/methylmalonate-semialdehyde dehydrogenase [Rhodothalassium salexigens DSM 2132]MBK1638437.1 methylmalonate-semialdehyde dehydrogenase (CoA acylating) [Rhodothalassium salexigens DSM 2132]TCP38278.1 malonate-semialdehyde dehydrogenase (acetylating)/methylmalonate-semialdehyde dehydrogenase [Rhodothalassium salexigens DSM 2132]
MNTDLGHFIGGHHVAGTSGRRGDVFNPSTGEVQATVAFAARAEVEAAIADAETAFAHWSATPVVKRANTMFRFRELVMGEQESLARMLASQHGKVFADAMGDVRRGLDVIDFACGIPHFMKGEYSNNVSTGIDLYSMRKPLGVVAAITPFNFPAMIPMWMVGVAIACGNAVVLKPSEKTPGVPLRLAELMVEAGAPEGVLNVVNGDKEAVDTLLEDPRVKAVSFVGSTDIARHVYATGTAHGKRVQAMGGAKNHMIVLPDADMDQVVDALIGSAFGSAGERCMANPVAVPVGDDLADALVERLVPRIQALKIGPSLDAEMDLGPLVTDAHWQRVKGYIDLGVEEGAELVVDGRDYRVPTQGYEKGFYMGGSLFDRVTPAMTSYQDEIFGPVLQIVRAATPEAAVRLPSAHRYGNGTSIFTNDGDAAREFADKVEVGMVGINVPIPVPLAFHTFGGWKASAFGDINQHGEAGVRFFTKTKTVTSRWPGGIRGGADFTIPTA